MSQIYKSNGIWWIACKYCKTSHDSPMKAFHSAKKTIINICKRMSYPMG